MHAARAVSLPSVSKSQVRSENLKLETRNLKLLLVEAYAHSRRLQPVLRASETAAPPASVPKAPPAEVVSVLSHSPQRPERPERKPGIEEQHNMLRLTRITQNKAMGFQSAERTPA